MTALIDGIKYSLVSSLGLNQSYGLRVARPRGHAADLDMLQLSVPGYELVTGIDHHGPRQQLGREGARIIGTRPTTLPSWASRLALLKSDP